MVAVAPATPWIPKDDLLLKTAIENGASLESLARGAVEFSRRFTIKELHDRWHTLLYDPIASAEATARMIEFERSSKANSSKEAKSGHGKRKAESIRSCHHDTRKRTNNEPLNQGDLSFLVPPGDSCFMTEAGGPSYAFEGANFDDLHHVFPEVVRDSVPSSSVGKFPSGQQNTLEDPIQQNVLHKEVGQMDGGNVAMAGNCLTNAKAGTEGMLCSGFGDIHSSISECETSFHHLQYASTPPAMPDWKNNEDISVPEDGNIRGNDMQADLFCVPGDGDAVNRKNEYGLSAASVLKDSTACKDGYLAELSDSLFNFTSDDEMLMIDGGKDVIDKTYLGLSSLLLNSPDDHNEGTMPDMPETDDQAGVNDNHGVPPVAGFKQNEVGEIHSEPFCDSNQIQINTESQISMSPATANSEFPEIRDGVIRCTLNTEDPEIPCNDNLPLPSKPRPHSALRRTQSEANNLLHTGKGNIGTQATMKRDAKSSRETHPTSHTTNLGATLNHSADDFGVKFEGNRGENLNGLRKSVASQGASSKSTLVAMNDSTKCPLIKHPPSDASEKFGQVTSQGYLQTGCGGSNQEGQTMSATQNQEIYAVGSADPLAAEPGGEPILSEDEQFSDSDIPCFSDVESLILDMDLIPEGRDSLYQAEVAKYQNEDAKRGIIRLEQNAHSYIHRTLAAHGAFAMLYGRHSKHYIKKPEVLLGRGTNEVPVDIDLSKEGRANKISRRQAIMKLEKDGTFILRNMGKGSIYVNNKEVYPGLTLRLRSNSLIEIRGMPFIFEANQALVKKYLDNSAAPRSEAKRPNV